MIRWRSDRSQASTLPSLAPSDSWLRSWLLLPPRSPADDQPIPSHPTVASASLNPQTSSYGQLCVDIIVSGRSSSHASLLFLSQPKRTGGVEEENTEGGTRVEEAECSRNKPRAPFLPAARDPPAPPLRWKSKKASLSSFSEKMSSFSAPLSLSLSIYLSFRVLFHLVRRTFLFLASLRSFIYRKIMEIISVSWLYEDCFVRYDAFRNTHRYILCIWFQEWRATRM